MAFAPNVRLLRSESKFVEGEIRGVQKCADTRRCIITHTVTKSIHAFEYKCKSDVSVKVPLENDSKSPKHAKHFKFGHLTDFQDYCRSHAENLTAKLCF